MPPMATPPLKRKWSVLLEEETDEKQLLMDLCAAKLRYVNPPRPPKRRTEVPLLRSVLIVNAMKHLSTEIKNDKTEEFSTEDLTVDPGHFEGLPPLSELLTDIMLDPQPLSSPNDLHASLQQSHSQASYVSWSPNGPSHYSPLSPVQPSVPSYLDPESIMETGDDEKIVHEMLPCTSVLPSDAIHPSSSPWEMQTESSLFDSFLSDSVFSQSQSGHTLNSDMTFQQSRNPLPSFTSLFDSTNGSATYRYTDMSSPQVSSSTNLSESFASSPANMITPSLNLVSTEESVGNANLSESELEILAMTLSAKLPTLSIEELVQALPQSGALSQNPPQATSSFFVPSSLHSSNSGADVNPATNNQCASYCRQDQPTTTVDDNSMVRVLVNL